MQKSITKSCLYTTCLCALINDLNLLRVWWFNICIQQGLSQEFEGSAKDWQKQGKRFYKDHIMAYKWRKFWNSPVKNMPKIAYIALNLFILMTNYKKIKALIIWRIPALAKNICWLYELSSLGWDFFPARAEI